MMETARRESAVPFDVPYAVASGFREITGGDFEDMRLQFPVYDALYAYCRTGLA